MTANF